MVAFSILQKRFLRSDRLWTHGIGWLPILRRIPFWLDTYALTRSQYWKPEKIGMLQDARIQKLFRHAATFPFWKEVFTEAEIDTTLPLDRVTLSRLRVVSKKDFLASDMKRYTDAYLMPGSLGEETSGSTGVPFQFFHNNDYFLRSYAVCERHFRAVSGGKHCTVVSMRTQDRGGFAFFDYYFFQILGFNHIKFRFDALITLLKSLRGEAILFTLPSSLSELAHIAHERNIRLPLRGALLFGEELSESRRTALVESTGITLRAQYALSEVGRLAVECESRRLHLNEEWAYLEIVDENGTALVPRKEGRVLVTLFDNDVMPFIRYATGDRGIIDDTPCPCGRTLRTLRLFGREATLVTFPDGRRVSLIGMTVSFDTHFNTIRQYQIVRTGAYDFLVRIVPGPGFVSVPQALQDDFIRASHPKANVSWELVESIEASSSGNRKAVYYLDETA